MDFISLSMIPAITRTFPQDTNKVLRSLPRRDPVRPTGLTMPTPPTLQDVVSRATRIDNALDRLHAKLAMGPLAGLRGTRRMAAYAEDVLCEQAAGLEAAALFLASKEQRAGYLRQVRDVMRGMWVRTGWEWAEKEEKFLKKLGEEMTRWMAVVKELFDRLTWQRKHFARMMGRAPLGGGIIGVAKAIAAMDRAQGDGARL